MAIRRGITRDDVVAAIRDFDAGVAHPYGESTRYDLVVSGRRYPPKAIVGLAARRVSGGRFLDPVTEFSGGEARANRVLRALGFSVAVKPAQATMATDAPRGHGGTAPYSEGDLLLPTLALLEQAPAGLTATDLIRLLTELLAPEGHDADAYGGRRDTVFSQKVRNLVGSHKRLEREGLATKDGPRHPYVITPVGVARVAAERTRASQEVREVLERRGVLSGTRFADYNEVTPAPWTRTEPFSVDPDAVDRATGGHAETQNELSRWVRALGLRPKRWAGGFAEFDLAWEDGPTLYVAEVKSLTARNETRQLRLGLGQVLHYQWQLREAAPRVMAVLAVERAPADTRWLHLCASHHVSLVWPGVFDRLLPVDHPVAAAATDEPVS